MTDENIGIIREALGAYREMQSRNDFILPSVRAELLAQIERAEDALAQVKPVKERAK